MPAFRSNHLVNKILLEYFLKSEVNQDDLINNVILEKLSSLWGTKFSLKTHFGKNLSKTFCACTEDEDTMATFRFHARNSESILFVIDIECPLAGPGLKTQTEVINLAQHLRGSFNDLNLMNHWQFMPMIRLGDSSNSYLATSDDRVVEYRFESVLFDEVSEFQHIQVVDTIDHGRILILDGFVNLSEADTENYTHQLMGLPQENYKRSEVLILGGGDGALLKELLELEHPPDFVTMIEIDPLVMEACKKFMPSVCGNYLSQGHGEKFEVIVGDALVHMEKLLAQNKKFDYIFGDLTDTPVNSKDHWEFTKTVINLSIKLLKPKGKYLTHSNGKCSFEMLDMFEKKIENEFDGKLDFSRSERFVSSFMEVWVFYQLFLTQKS